MKQIGYNEQFELIVATDSDDAIKIVKLLEADGRFVYRQKRAKHATHMINVIITTSIDTVSEVKRIVDSTDEIHLSKPEPAPKPKNALCDQQFVKDFLKRYYAPSDFESSIGPDASPYAKHRNWFVKYKINFKDGSNVEVVMTDMQRNCVMRSAFAKKYIDTIGGKGYVKHTATGLSFLPSGAANKSLSHF
jgi:hypothetical protein